MNERGKEILIQAGLKGHPQARGILHDVIEGECALGVLHLAVHGNSRRKALSCHVSGSGEVMERFDISEAELERIINLNDYDKLDFIGIVRKLDEEEPR